MERVQARARSSARLELLRGLRAERYATASHVGALLETAERAGRALRGWLAPRLSTLAGAGAVCALVPAVQLSSETVRYAEIGFTVLFVILSLSLHEAAHAWTAWKCGDPTAKDLGRITLNPLPSIDPIMTVIMPLWLAAMGLPAFGGAKPVPVSYHRLHHPLRDMMLVAIAGPLTNLLLGVVFMLGWKAAAYYGGYPSGSLLLNVLGFSMMANLVLAAFNMLPIPPLDGSRVMTWLLPASLRDPYTQFERFGLFIVFGVWFFVPGVKRFVFSGVNQLEALLDFLTGGVW
jgi:Zn-dependent protease